MLNFLTSSDRDQIIPIFANSINDNTLFKTNMKKAKFILSTLLLVAITALFSACGPKPNPDNGGDGGATQPEQQVEPKSNLYIVDKSNTTKFAEGLFCANGQTITFKQTVKKGEEASTVGKLFISTKKGAQYNFSLSFDPAISGSCCLGSQCQALTDKKAISGKVDLIADSEADPYGGAKEAGEKTPMDLHIQIPEEFAGKVYKNSTKVVFENASDKFECTINFEITVEA